MAEPCPGLRRVGGGAGALVQGVRVGRGWRAAARHRRGHALGSLRSRSLDRACQPVSPRTFSRRACCAWPHVLHSRRPSLPLLPRCPCFCVIEHLFASLASPAAPAAPAGTGRPTGCPCRACASLCRAWLRAQRGGCSRCRTAGDQRQCGSAHRPPAQGGRAGGWVGGWVGGWPGGWVGGRAGGWDGGRMSMWLGGWLVPAHCMCGRVPAQPALTACQFRLSVRPPHARRLRKKAWPPSTPKAWTTAWRPWPTCCGTWATLRCVRFMQVQIRLQLFEKAYKACALALLSGLPQRCCNSFPLR